MMKVFSIVQLISFAVVSSTHDTTEVPSNYVPRPYIRSPYMMPYAYGGPPVYVGPGGSFAQPGYTYYQPNGVNVATGGIAVGSGYGGSIAFGGMAFPGNYHNLPYGANSDSSHHVRRLSAKGPLRKLLSRIPYGSNPYTNSVEFRTAGNGYGGPGYGGPSYATAVASTAIGGAGVGGNGVGGSVIPEYPMYANPLDRLASMGYNMPAVYNPYGSSATFTQAGNGYGGPGYGGPAYATAPGSTAVGGAGIGGTGIGGSARRLSEATKSSSDKRSLYGYPTQYYMDLGRRYTSGGDAYGGAAFGGSAPGVGGNGFGGAAIGAIGSTNTVYQSDSGAPVFIGPTYGAPAIGGSGFGGSGFGGLGGSAVGGGAFGGTGFGRRLRENRKLQMGGPIYSAPVYYPMQFRPWSYVPGVAPETDQAVADNSVQRAMAPGQLQQFYPMSPVSMYYPFMYPMSPVSPQLYKVSPPKGTSTETPANAETEKVETKEKVAAAEAKPANP